MIVRQPTGPTCTDVVVLDGDLPQALTVVRSLGRAGARVHVVASTKQALSFKSKYCSGRSILPSPTRAGSDFVDKLADFLAQFDDVLVFPISDRSLLPLVEFEERLPVCATVVRAANESLEKALSKAETLSIARQHAIPCPGSYTIQHEAEIEDVVGKLPLPIVIKPDRSFTSSKDGGLHSHVVKYASTKEDARSFIREVLVDGPVLVQQFVSGDGVGIGALADNGKILSLFQWRRLHEVPITGGGSSYRVSEPITAILRQYAEALLGDMEWTGVAMVEFKHDKERDVHYLMEVNGRFWGSLPLAVVSGVDFPAQLYHVYKGKAPEVAPGYRIGIRCRQLQRDVEWVVQALEARRNKSANAPSMYEIVRDCFRIFHPRDFFDVQAWDDPLPGLYDLGELIRSVCRRARKKFA